VCSAWTNGTTSFEGVVRSVRRGSWWARRVDSAHANDAARASSKIELTSEIIIRWIDYLANSDDDESEYPRYWLLLGGGLRHDTALRAY
jgi:hypothetical protein